MKKKIVIYTVLIVGILCLGIGGYFFYQTKQEKPDGPAVKIDEYEFGDIYQYETDDIREE